MRSKDRKRLQRKTLQEMLDFLARRPICSYWRRFYLLVATAIHDHDARRYNTRPTGYQHHPAAQHELPSVPLPFGALLPFNRTYLRLTPDEFQDLLSRVATHDVFAEAPRGRRQASVQVQLGVFLSRLADDGLSVDKCALDWGVSVGSVVNFSMRAAAAIASLTQSVIVWPRGKYKRALKYEIFDQYGIPGCLGFIDGVHIPLRKAPAMPEESARCFWTRKKTYALLVLAACDSTKRFIYARIGMNGAASDIRVQNESELCTNPSALFRHGEHFIGDAGFRATKYITPMYKNAQDIGLLPYQEYFNDKCTSPRVAIEHAFGMLKNRWRALKNLDVRLAPGWLEHTLVWNIVEAAMVLHNLYIDTIDVYRPASHDWCDGNTLSREWNIPQDYDASIWTPRDLTSEEHVHREHVAYLTAYWDRQVSSAQLSAMFPHQPPGLERRDFQPSTFGV
ncbi:unnamed protein product [Cutaneotrichosporon oleaginosum]